MILIGEVFAKFCKMECLDHQATAVRPKVAMDHHSFTLLVGLQNNRYRLFDILPADIIDLLFEW